MANALNVLHIPNNEGGLRGARMVTAAPRYAVGTKARIPSDVSGAKDCLAVYCRNTEGGTLAPGNVVMLEAVNNDFNVVKMATGSHPTRVFGVVPSNLIDLNGDTLATVADDYYFWAIVQGSVDILKDGVTTSAVGDGVTGDTSTAGITKKIAATSAAIGYYLEADGSGSAGLYNAYVSCPAGVREF
jgi:hypothetical protein